MAAVNLMEIGQAAGPQRDQRTVSLDQTEQFRDARQSPARATTG